MSDWRHHENSHRIPKQLALDKLPPTALAVALFMFHKAEERRRDTKAKDDCVQVGYAEMMDAIAASRGAIASAIKFLLVRGWIFQTEGRGPKRMVYIVQVAPDKIHFATIPRKVKKARLAV